MASAPALLWALVRLFRAEVLRLLVARGKISGELVGNLLTWRHGGFSVHAGAPVEERSDAVRLGRYGIRCPLVLERLEWDEAGAEIDEHAARGRRQSSPWRVSTTARSPPPEDLVPFVVIAT